MQFNRGDTVVYGIYGICKIKEISFTSFSHDRPKEKYYVLSPSDSKNSTYYVPFSSADESLRLPMSKCDVEALIESARSRHIDWPENRQQRSDLFRQIIYGGISEELILLLGCLYTRRLELSTQNKTLSSTDEIFLTQAKTLLHSEFAYSLGLNKEEVSSYICELFNK